MNLNTNKKNVIGRPKTFDKDSVIKLAMLYFWEHGYNNSSLDNLLLTMGIKKSSFYRTFKSKEELFSACLAFYREDRFRLIGELSTDIGAKQTMLMLTTGTIDELRSTGRVKGCLLINSGKECYNKYDDLSIQITIEFNFMQNVFAGLIESAQKSGDIFNKKDPKIIAGRYMNTLNGLVASIQAGASEELIEDIVASLTEMLD